MNSQSTINVPSSGRILVRGVNWLGDAVMTTPALLRLRERFPDAHISLFTPAKLEDLWLNHPAINEIVTFPADESVIGCGRILRPHDFDLALVLPNSPRSALETWLARVPQRIGYARPWRNWLLTHAIPARPGHTPMRKLSDTEIRKLVANPAPHHPSRAPFHTSAHHIHEYLHLVAALGGDREPLPPFLEVSEEEVACVRRKFSLANGSVWLGINPGAEYGPAKRWPKERFVAVGREIQKCMNCAWIIFGGDGEAQLAAGIESEIANRGFEVRNLAGKTALRELCALLKICRVLLTNDTGPMHVAAAVGTPVVALFGSTSPELTAPGLAGDSRLRLLNAVVPCSPCFRRECPIDFRCMTGIGVEQAVEAVLANLKG